MENKKLKRLFKKAVENKIDNKERLELYKLLLQNTFPNDAEVLFKSYMLIQATTSPLFTNKEKKIILNNIKYNTGQVKK